MPRFIINVYDAAQRSALPRLQCASYSSAGKDDVLSPLFSCGFRKTDDALDISED